MHPDEKLRVQLTFENPERWEKLQELFHGLTSVNTSQELVVILGDIYKTSGNKAEELKGYVRGEYSEKWPFTGLQVFLEDIASNAERAKFFQTLLPFIANLASNLDQYSPEEGLQFISRQYESSIPLNRKFIASLIASGFLCSFPPSLEESSTRTLNFANFFSYFHRSEYQAVQSAKLRCFLHYFERLAKSNLDLPGNVIFTRQVVSESILPSLDGWAACAVPLCPVVIDSKNGVEDADSSLLQVDFANCFIGGGVLGCGHTQEEIRFCINPELMVSMMFMEAMEDNEAIIIKGTERFSSYSGYEDTFRFTGDYHDNTQRDMCGNLETTVVAMDATSFKHQSRDKQYEQGLVLRELNKVLISFHSPEAGCTLINTTRRSSDVVDVEDSGITYITNEDPVRKNTKPVPGLDELGVELISRVFQEAWGDLEMSCACSAGDSGDLLTNLMKKSVEEVFKKTPEKMRLYTETVTNSSLVPKCLQYQDSGSEPTSPQQPRTPPSSRNVSGNQTPVSAPGPSSILSGATLATSSFADSLSKSLLSCVSLTSSLANSIATVASTPIQLTTVTKETFQKSPKDLGSPVKNGEKLISFLSRKVYSESSEVEPKEINYNTVSEFTEDLTSIIGMQKSDWSKEEARKGKLHAPDSPDFEYIDLCACTDEEESEARRRSLEELALSLFEDFASSVASSVIESAVGSFGRDNQLPCIAEESEASEDENEISYSDEDSEGSKQGEFSWEEKCESVLEQECEYLSEEELGVNRECDLNGVCEEKCEPDASRDSEVLHDIPRVVCGNQHEVLRDNHCSALDDSHQSVLRDKHHHERSHAFNRELLRVRYPNIMRDSYHDSDSDSEHDEDVPQDWNSSDIEREIEDKFYDLDLSDEDESTGQCGPDASKRIPELAAKISVDALSDGINEAATNKLRTSDDKAVQDEQGKQVYSGKSDSEEMVYVNEEVYLADQVTQDNLHIDSYTLSYEEPNNNCSDTIHCGPMIMVTHAEGFSTSILHDALHEATQHIMDSHTEEHLLDFDEADKEIKRNGVDDEIYVEDARSVSVERVAVEEASGNQVKKTGSVLMINETLDCTSTDCISDGITEGDDTSSTNLFTNPVQEAALCNFANTMSRQLIESSVALVDASARISGGIPNAYPVATGNWGCGVFRGDPKLKAVLQWLAASVAGCPALVFHTFGDKRLYAQFFKVQQTLRRRDWRVRDVMQVVSCYCELAKEQKSEDDGDNASHPSLFELLLQES